MGRISCTGILENCFTINCYSKSCFCQGLLRRHLQLEQQSVKALRTAKTKRTARYSIYYKTHTSHYTVHIIKNENDAGMTPCQKLVIQEGKVGMRVYQNGQSSATPQKQGGCRRLLHTLTPIYLAGPSCINSFWHGVIPT